MGLTGIVQRQQALFYRLAHGPKPKPGADHAEIARLERELFGAPE